MQLWCATTVIVFLIASLIPAEEGRLICQHDSYVVRSSSSLCYRYVLATATYSQAKRRCERDGGNLLYINSAEEDTYVWAEMFAGQGSEDFWVGLDDQLNEGDFRWLHNNSRPTYTNYSEGFTASNNVNLDCVRYTGTGWQLATDFCENIGMPFVCKAPMCESGDGVVCDAVLVEESGGGGFSVGGIAAIAIVIIILICVIVVVVLLVLLWKFKNDAFHRYICPCVGGASKQAMMSLQQENQRLRQELNQSKMNASGRYSQSYYGRDSMSGVPDGLGGLLPALKPGGGGGYLGPEPRSVSSATQPPALSLQRGTSRVSPMTPSAGPFFPSSSTTGPPVFTAPIHRAARPVMKPGGMGGAAVGGVSLPPVKESVVEELADSTSESEGEEPNSDKVKGQAGVGKAAKNDVSNRGQSAEVKDEDDKPEKTEDS